MGWGYSGGLPSRSRGPVRSDNNPRYSLTDIPVSDCRAPACSRARWQMPQQHAI